MKEENFKFKDFTYTVSAEEADDKLNLSLTHKNTLPEFLFKYYSINKNNVDAFCEGYLFASHPYQLNDKYDCSADLIDYSNCSLELLIEKSKSEGLADITEHIKEKYNSDNKRELERDISNLERDRLMKKFGIISFTKNKIDILMWAYYAQNRGFVLEFEISKLNKKWFGPFPINYCDSLEKLDISKCSPPMSLFYQTNIKQNIWEHEDEWRYLAYNPKGNYHPYHLKEDYKTRFQFYNRTAVRQIILGYDFIEPNYIKRIKNTDYIKLRNKMQDYKLKLKILNYIVKNKIPVSLIVRDIRTFSLITESITINKLSSNTFEIEHKNTK